MADAPIEIVTEQFRFEQIPHWVAFHPDVIKHPRALLLYVLLRRYAGSRTVAWPSRATLANDLGVSLPTLKEAREVLVSIGAITITPRVEDGRQTSSLYFVRFYPVDKSVDNRGEPVDKEGEGVSTVTGGGVSTVTPRGVSTVTPNTYTYETYTDEYIPIVDKFDTFWDAYPRKVAKGQARSAWVKAVRKADADVLIAAAQRFAEARKGQDQTFTAYPSTWLNGERWNDNPETLIHPLTRRRSAHQTRLQSLDLLISALEAKEMQ